MEKDYSRTLRRHHIARLKNARKKYQTVLWCKESPYARRLGMAIQTPKLCSCFMCGNARKWWKQRTIPELRDFERFEYDMEEVYSPD